MYNYGHFDSKSEKLAEIFFANFCYGRKSTKLRVFLDKPVT